jgi:hypothetical protein
MADDRNMPQTFFAPSQRSTDTALALEIEWISNNSAINQVLQAVGGYLAVLNANRQVVALNEGLLAELGITEPHRVFGLRLGEALGCIHGQEPPNGCGTTPSCVTCGALLAMMSSMKTGRAQENECVATVIREGVQEDFYFKVRSCPIEVQEQTFLLFLLQNYTDEQYWAALERTFFHDIGNIISALSMAGEMLDNHSQPGVPGSSGPLERYCRSAGQ